MFVERCFTHMTRRAEKKILLVWEIIILLLFSFYNSFPSVSYGFAMNRTGTAGRSVPAGQSVSVCQSVSPGRSVLASPARSVGPGRLVPAGGGGRPASRGEGRIHRGLTQNLGQL